MRARVLHPLIAWVVIFNVQLVYAQVEYQDPATLVGRFRADGLPQPPAQFRVPGQAQQIEDDSLLVNEHNFGIANVFVRLYLTRGELPPQFDPQRIPKQSDIVLQNFQVQPRLSVVYTNQVVRVTNRMPIATNIIFDLISNMPKHTLIHSDEVLEFNLTRPERLPCMVSASIHSWLTARIAVVDHPFAAVTDRDGKFRIDGLPPGPWTFQVWHERCGYVQSATRNDTLEPWPKGRANWELESGRNDLGEIQIDVKSLERKVFRLR